MRNIRRNGRGKTGLVADFASGITYTFARSLTPIGCRLLGRVIDKFAGDTGGASFEMGVIVYAFVKEFCSH